MAAQLVAEEVRGLLQDGIEGLVSSGIGASGGRLRNFHPDLGGEFAHSLAEFHVFIIHEEAQRRAVGAAAETMIELLARTHGEGGALFLVKRAAGDVVPACFAQLDARIDHVDDVDATHEFVDELLGNAAGHRLRIVCRRDRKR